MSAVLELNPIPATSKSKKASKAVAPAQAPAPAEPAVVSPVLGIVQKALETGADMTMLTALYLKLRNAKKDLDEQAKTKTSPLKEGMDLIEAHFLDQMNKLGVDSLKNEAGTPYRSELVSVTVADNSAFVDYVLTRALASLPVTEAARDVIKNAIVESGQLALIEARASKSAVEAVLEETSELPPGLNRRVEAKVNVRTSS